MAVKESCTLLTVFFNTGEAKDPYYGVPVCLIGPYNKFAIEETIWNYSNEVEQEDVMYEDIVGEALDRCEYKWWYITGKIPQLDRIDYVFV